MNDEVREILKDFNSMSKGAINPYELTDKDCKLLLDYITNLQEENKEWSMIFDTFSRRPYAHKYLEEKRKELNNDNIVGLDSEMIYKDYYNLQNKIDNAVEYIESCTINPEDLSLYENITKEEYLKLLDILRGEE